jgi:hypothetical protein
MDVSIDASLIANFLRINIYLTQKINDDMLWNITVNEVGADYDPLTLLRSRTMFGRPDWNAIYARIRQAVEGGQYIPGANSQLRTRVGVRRFSETIPLIPTNLFVRLTSAVPVLLQRPSRRLP